MIIESDIDCPSKAVHIINFGEKDCFTVGRRVNNDISISDISVSRRQATFKLDTDKVYLMDLDSKFGTFQRLNQPLPIPADGSIVPIQIEKKCFFFRQEFRFSNCNRICASLCGGKTRDGELYDHFLTEFDKYPISVRDYLAPFL